MPNPESDLIKSIVSERLKHIDGLVKAQKIDEAVTEITEIRKLDAKNPYALAYEERIKTLQQTLKSQPARTPFNPTPLGSELRKEGPPQVKNNNQSAQSSAQAGPVVATNREMYSIAPGTTISQIQNSFKQVLPDLQKKPKGKANILLVDDDMLLVQALAELLEDNRYSTKSYTRAEEALEYLKGNSPDLVICDVNLETSTFGGFTLHEKMRKFEHLKDVPFIFLSGLSDTAIVLAGKELGADDYLTKPVEPEALLSVIKGKLKRYRQIKKNS